MVFCGQVHILACPGTENRPLSSPQLFVDSLPVVLLQEREVLGKRNEQSPPMCMRAHFQGPPRRTALREKQKTRLYLQVTSTLTPAATPHSEPWRPNSVLVLLNFDTSIRGAFGRGDEMWTMTPFYGLFRKGNGASDARPQALWTWTVTTWTSRLWPIPQKKLEEVARSHASVVIDSCN